MKRIFYTILASLSFLIPLTTFAVIDTRSEQNLVPFVDNTYNLGTSILNWKNLFIKGNITNSTMTNGCASWSSGILTSLGVACGSGGGGSSGGTFSTTTSSVSGQLINYPNNNTDIVTVGGNSTSTAKFYFDPNLNKFVATGTSTQTDIFYQKDTSCNYVLEGDSMTDNVAQPNGWASWIEGYDHDFGKCLVVNKATTGDTVQNILSTYAAQIQPYKPVYGSDRRYFFLWAGTNDLNNGADGTTTYSFFKATAQMAKADGFKVIAVPVMERNQFTASAAKERQRQTFNNLLLQDSNIGLYDYIARPDLAINNPADATYYADSTHMTALGGQIVAQIIAATLHAQPWTISPFQYATTTAYTVAWNPGGNNLFGTTSNQIKPNAVVTIAATSSDLVSNTFEVLNTASTTVLKVNNAGLTIPTGLVMGTSTLTGKYVDIGSRTFAPTETTPSYALGVVNESATGFAAVFDGGGAVNQPGRLLVRGSTNGNARPFSGACIQGGISGSGYTTSFGQFGSASGAATCKAQPEITVINGNTGIGTSTPTATFQIRGTTLSTGVTFQTENSNNAPLVTFLDGKVNGFGTTTPSMLVSIDKGAISNNTADYGMVIAGDAAGAAGFVGQEFILNNSTGNTAAYSRLARTAATIFLGWEQGVSSRDGIRWLTGTTATDPTEWMRLTAQGLLGVGTSSPHEKLTVNGNAYIAGFITATSTATSTFQGPIRDKGTKSLSFNMSAVTSAGNFDGTTKQFVWRVPRNITITRVIGTQVGATNVIGGIYNCTAAAVCTAVDSDITITTGEANDNGSLSTPNMTEGTYLGWRTTSVSGTNVGVTITVLYKENF